MVPANLQRVLSQQRDKSKQLCAIMPYGLDRRQGTLEFGGEGLGRLHLH
jgi:hypothetical protein